MTIADIRQKYLSFFEKRGHVIMSSASLLPENDPTTLFTGSGMQPMISYLLGETHPRGTRLVDSQKCFRAQDIEEVGDNRHTTFFEMLGNWSFGDYFKTEQIDWMFDFLIDEIGLDPKHLYVTVFRGNDTIGIPRDEETVKLWQAKFQTKGVEAPAVDFSEEQGMQGGRIFFYPEKKNWWSRAGVPGKMPVGEPGGPDTEMFWDFGAELKLHESSAWKSEPCHVNCDCGRFVEIGNNVFMQYKKTEQGFEKLPKPNVDFGGGLERIAAALMNDPDVFKTDGLRLIVTRIEEASGKTYGADDASTRAFRIIADHVRAATFIIGDPRGVVPSNVGQGYVVRRLLRRAIREARRLGIQTNFMIAASTAVIDVFGSHYQELAERRDHILAEVQKEEEKFGRSLEKGMRELEKRLRDGQGKLSGEDAFILFSSYGFPLELTEEVMQEQGATVDRNVFAAEFKKHQDLSRTASAGTFKGGLADSSIETTRLHTATHLLHQALRAVLGPHVAQKGSNITAERLRFDFSHGQKMTPEEITEVERLVNEAIKTDHQVRMEEMSVDEAKSRGVIGLFEDKYAQVGDKIKVYFVGDFSKEICGGPHVAHTAELGSFKIQKEEAVSAGVRRIKATVTGLV